MKFLFEQSDTENAKKCYQENGFCALDGFFPEKDIIEIKNAVSSVKQLEGVELYLDRAGLMRRIENFTFKNKFLTELNKRIEKILYTITDQKQNLFKDKVNFKPAGGEGFYPHYDGVFQFTNSEGIRKNGWYEYASDFNNVLICLDNFTIENGTLELARADQQDFEVLLKNTKGNGSPDLKDELINALQFYPILANAGSLAIFKHTCPHRSSPNHSSSERGSLYLTYNNSNEGNFYKKYFDDKKSSSNEHKALLGEQAKSS